MLQRGSAAFGGLLLGGCDRLSQSPSFHRILSSAEQLTYRAQRLIVGQSLAREFTTADLSPVFRSNGTARPSSALYNQLLADNFDGWRLMVGGLVNRPLALSLAELRALPARTQITRHDASKDGAPSASGRSTAGQCARAGATGSAGPFIVLFSADELVRGDGGYYESIDLMDAFHPQTLLAYELNGRPLPVANGAPLRLRVERQLGYKQAKYLMRIEAVERLDGIAGGKGGTGGSGLRMVRGDLKRSALEFEFMQGAPPPWSSGFDRGRPIPRASAEPLGAVAHSRARADGGGVARTAAPSDLGTVPHEAEAAIDGLVLPISTAEPRPGPNRWRAPTPMAYWSCIAAFESMNATSARSSRTGLICAFRSRSHTRELWRRLCCTRARWMRTVRFLLPSGNHRHRVRDGNIATGARHAGGHCGHGGVLGSACPHLDYFRAAAFGPGRAAIGEPTITMNIC